MVYIGHLSLERALSTASLPQYLFALYRFHFVHGLPSPTTTPIKRALVRAFRQKRDASTPQQSVRVKCQMDLIHDITMAGLHSCYPRFGCACASSFFSFIFMTQSVSLSDLRDSDLTFNNSGICETTCSKRARCEPSSSPLISSFPFVRSGQPYSLITALDSDAPY